MNYLDYKQLEKSTLETNNIDAISYLLETCWGSNGIISSRIKSFKYNHSDLNEIERKQLLKLNNLNEDDILIGGEVHRVIFDTQRNEFVLTKVDEIELFTILHQIHWIKTKGAKQPIYKKN